jgi:hypothetical protein
MTRDKEQLKDNGCYAKTLEKDHGRIEKRECYITSDIEWLDGRENWAGLAGIGVIVSRREELGKEATVGKNYFIYSLKDATADDF